MAQKTPAKITDVARRAGVSTATVSRTINADGPVSKETASLVRAAISELNYNRLRKRSDSARKASPHRPNYTRPIAFLRLGVFPANLHHGITEDVIEGLDSAARVSGRSLSVGHVADLSSTSVHDVIGDAEGVIIRTQNQRQFIEKAVDWLNGIPAVRVLGENIARRTLVDHVTPDNTEVGTLAVEYLTGQQCRKLVFASTDTAPGVMSERCISFTKAAIEADFDVTIALLEGTAADDLKQELSGLNADFMVATDRLDLVRQVAEVNGGKFGLFMPRDLEMAMVMPQLQVIGVDFGGNSFAIGCDNEMRCLSELDPMPATIDLHVEDVAARAIRRLEHRIEHPDETRVRITVAPDVVTPETKT